MYFSPRFVLSLVVVVMLVIYSIGCFRNRKQFGWWKVLIIIAVTIGFAWVVAWEQTDLKYYLDNVQSSLR